MRTIKDQTFGAERVIVDACSYVHCTFNRTTIVFAGGQLPRFKDCPFNTVTFDFEGPAAATVEFLRFVTSTGA